MVKKILGIVCLLFVANMTFAQKFSVQAPRVVSQGENFRIIFSAEADIDDFSAPKISGFTILAGPSKSTSSSMSIINGKTSSRTSVSYTYILQAKQKGTFTIPAAFARTEKGVTIGSTPVEIEVVDGNGGASAQSHNRRNDDGGSVESGSNLFVLVVPSKSTVYLGEPVTISIKLYTEGDSPIAGFENIKFPAFTGFWSQEYLSPQNITFQREKFRGKVYNVGLLRSYILFPQQTGDLTIDPFSLDIIMQVRRKSRDIFDDFFGGNVQNVRKALSSGNIKIRVKPLPTGAPESFKGAVGQFTMSANASRSNVMANSGFSINLKLNGTGNLKLIESPLLQLPPDFESYEAKVVDNFKNTPHGSSGSKVFEIPVIARSAGSFSIDPVAFTYFNPQTGKYVTLTSDPIHIDVAKDPNAGSGNMLSGAVGKEEIKLLGKDIRHIRLKMPALSPRSSIFFGSLWFYLIFLCILAALSGAYIFLKKQHILLDDTVRFKSKRANKVVTSRLKKAKSMLDGNNEAFFEELMSALGGYLGDKLNISKADYSRNRAQETLTISGADQTTIEEFLFVMDECEFARYAPAQSQANRQELFEKAQQLISTLEQTLKS